MKYIYNIICIQAIKLCVFTCLHIYVKTLYCYGPFTCENFVQGEIVLLYVNFLSWMMFRHLQDMIMCHGKGGIRRL